MKKTSYVYSPFNRKVNIRNIKIFSLVASASPRAKTEDVR